MEYLNINDLKPHPKNDYLFDDMSGEKWEEFLESIKTRGVIEPIIVTADKTIVSGHQRVRACKELGIDKVLCDTRHYDSDDDIIIDLLDTNEKQRGTVGGSTVKLGRRIKEYERIYGIQHGNNQYNEDRTNGPLLSQEELAERLGINERTLKRAKQLANLSPEFQDMIESGRISASTAARVIAGLPEEEQIQLLSKIPATGKITQKEVEQLVSKNKELQNDNYEKIEKIKSLNDRLIELSNKLSRLESELKERPTVEIQAIPGDYADLKNKAATSDRYKRESDAYKRDYQREQQRHAEKSKEVLELKKQIKELTDKINDIQFGDVGGKSAERAVDASIYFCAGVMNFIRKYGGYVWITNYINDLPSEERKNYMKAVESIYSWSNILLNNIKGVSENELPE